MSITEVLLLAAGLSMDAFATAVCKGLAMPKLKWNHMCIVGLWFGGFQMLMPLIGNLLGEAFAVYISSIGHWVAFVLLVIIGGNMIKEAAGGAESSDGSLAFKSMLTMAVATSIDALAAGITFAFLIDSTAKLVMTAFVIGCTTFLFSAVGVKIGNMFGIKYKSKAELAGGIILILLGIKTLAEGLGWIG